MMRLKKDDKVMIVSGKDKGKSGKVKRVIHAEDRVVIEKLNLVKRHTKPGMDQTQGGIIEKEASLHRSNVMLFCDKCDKAVRSGVRKMSDNSSARYCKQCEELFDK